MNTSSPIKAPLWSIFSRTDWPYGAFNVRLIQLGYMFTLNVSHGDKVCSSRFYLTSESPEYQSSLYQAVLIVSLGWENKSIRCRLLSGHLKQYFSAQPPSVNLASHHFKRVWTTSPSQHSLFVSFILFTVTLFPWGWMKKGWMEGRPRIWEVCNQHILHDRWGARGHGFPWELLPLQFGYAFIVKRRRCGSLSPRKITIKLCLRSYFDWVCSFLPTLPDAT